MRGLMVAVEQLILREYTPTRYQAQVSLFSDGCELVGATYYERGVFVGERR